MDRSCISEVETANKMSLMESILSGVMNRELYFSVQRSRVYGNTIRGKYQAIQNCNKFIMKLFKFSSTGLIQPSSILQVIFPDIFGVSVS